MKVRQTAHCLDIDNKDVLHLDFFTITHKSRVETCELHISWHSASLATSASAAPRQRQCCIFGVPEINGGEDVQHTTYGCHEDRIVVL